MNLDNQNDFNAALLASVNLGITHCAVNARRAAFGALIATLSAKFQQPINYRNFHREILNRAYGLAFIQAKKMAYVRASQQAKQ